MMETVSIENFLADRDPFRVAYPGPPLPFPTRLSLSSSNTAELFSSVYHSLLPQLPTILQHYNISMLNISTAQHWRTCEAEKQMTVLIQVHTVLVESTKHWAEAAWHIYSQFAEKGCSDIQVELRDPVRCLQDCILSDATAPEDTASVAAIVGPLRICLYDLGSRCLVIGLYMCGKRHHSTPPTPTVVIYVKEGSQYDWAGFLDACTDIAAPYQLAIRLQPSLLNATTPYDLEWGSGDQPITHYPRKPENGASIGIMGDTRAASLGAFVVLEGEGPNPRKRYCALTNYHLIAPANEDLAHQYYRTGASSEAPGITASVEYPSRGDLEVSIKSLKSDVSALEEVGNLSKRDKLLLGKLRSKLGSCLAMEDADRRLGPVLFSSGIRSGRTSCNLVDKLVPAAYTATAQTRNEGICGNKAFTDDHGRLDWALFEVLADSFTINKAPPASHISQESEQYLCGDSAVITEIADLKPNSWVAKVGRTTCVTSGHVNVNPLLVRWEDRFSTVNGDQIHVTWTWEQQMQRYPYFSRRGDEGSCIVDIEGRIVALLHGGIDTGGECITLVTPIKKVFAHIKATTK